MGLYKHLGNLWKKPTKESTNIDRERRIQWRKEPVTVRVEKPTRLDRARSLGYKAKSGIIIVRQRVDRGGRKRPDIKGGRRSKHARQVKILDKNYRAVSEERAASKYPNMEVLNSYYLGQDGRHYWHEVILVDRSIPEIAADKNLSWIMRKKARVLRGLTSAGRKSRGLRYKGKGAEKMRPSRTANVKRKYKKQRRSYGY
ncbi:50S ribosomal protein L15e [Candidatus Woesearchaeota archaeon]|nr:50S ribosomal protein L15e [Candidatus Woesearchaeota archaeon]|tara:strand:- start:38616 stop:39215 length:600 start_codon:yes stop_codon:yes gene_type:complete